MKAGLFDIWVSRVSLGSIRYGAGNMRAIPGNARLELATSNCALASPSPCQPGFLATKEGFPGYWHCLDRQWRSFLFPMRFTPKTEQKRSQLGYLAVADFF